MNVKTRKLGKGITNVVINDPKTYNSLSFKTLRDLLNTFIRLDKDNDTRVTVSYTHLTLPTKRIV